MQRTHRIQTPYPCLIAGSEKWDTRQDLDNAHTQELTNINFSLFTLGRCIAALTSKAGGHVPYRDSKLTR